MSPTSEITSAAVNVQINRVTVFQGFFERRLMDFVK